MATNKEMIKVDELNRLYNSNNPNDIIKFYGNFNTPEELIGWSRSRPHGRAKIYTVKGDTDIVVVIPTADRHGKYAKNCEKKIFKGQQIVFVESGGRDDPYFNYARNCNIGLRYALRYKPKWIVLSGDDAYKIDDITKLKIELSKINENKFDVIFINPSPDYYHSYTIRISKRTLISKIIRRYLSARESRHIEAIFDKFQVSVVGPTPKKVIKRIIFPPITKSFIQIGDFNIFSYKFLHQKNGKVFDTVFINGFDDIDLSLQLKDKTYRSINFMIGSNRENVLGQNFNRYLRDLLNRIYFDFKFKESKMKKDRI